MKLRLLTFLLCLTAYTNAQTPDKAVAVANYTLVYVRDTTNREHPYTEDFVLLLGKNGSVYRSLDKQRKADDVLKQIQSQFKSAANPHAVDLTLYYPSPAMEDEYYQYASLNKLYTERKIVNYYLTEEPLPIIKWKISKDTLSFSGLHCQKATTHFKGRDYTAWFCPELPFRSGPWKLNGLPGLILEAYDAKKEVTFKFVGFENKNSETDVIKVPENDIKASVADLDRLEEAKRKDPVGFTKAAHSGGNSQRNNAMNDIPSSDIKSINIIADGSGKVVINNPIELPEKK